ncbi:MAG: hypothetical protein U9N87_14035, partial [Planctomycetota bacterium]|nr:hypothetical protein [Planctomycetota bacterium]
MQKPLSISTLVFIAVLCTSIVAAADKSPAKDGNSKPVWKNPLVKKGRLGSPLVEVTPLAFNGRLYLLENNQKFWNLPGTKPGDRFMEDEVRIRDVKTGKLVSVALTAHAFATALVVDGRVYVFAGEHDKDKPWRRITKINMASSTDLKNWTNPVTVIEAQSGEVLFNTAVCPSREKGKFVLLYETNDR